MARKPRILFEGAIYHLTFRGNARAAIFKDDADRERLRVRLAESAQVFGVRVYAYCFMTNHVHLLVETPQGNLSRFMSSVLTGYTIYFNRRHRRVGHLMQGRYGAKAVQGDEYLLRLSRYIHLNPVFVGGWEKKPIKDRIHGLREYRWSSYRGYSGLAKPDEWVDRAPLLAQTEAYRGKREKAYRRYVEAGIAQTDEEFMDCLRASPWGLGSDAFLAKVAGYYEAIARGRVKEEDVALRRCRRRLPLEKVLEVLRAGGLLEEALLKRRRGCLARAVAAYCVIKYAGLTQRAVATWLGLRSGSAISHQLKILKEQMPKDKGVCRRMAELKDSLDRYFKG